MILPFLRSKPGVVVMTVLVTAMFFTLSKLKQRSAREADAGKAATSLEAAPAGTGGAEQAALLKRAQETARGRAEAARAERETRPRRVSGYDEAGNSYERRLTPAPLDVQSLQGGGPEPDGAPAREARGAVPSLRIRGRRSSAAAPASLDPGPGTSRQGEREGSPGPAPAANEEELRRPSRFVPFGRLIKAELVMTLESTIEEMPLIGLVVEPVYNNGRLVIPAGTEVHSMARPDRIRNRILSTNKWRMIFPRDGNKPNGRQVTFDAIALDREDHDGSGLHWGITDGSYGLRGRVLRFGQTSEEMLLFASEALKASSASLMDRQTTLTGTQVESSAKNAALAGGQAVLNTFSERLSREVERNGVYIQVPAGKQFYIYPRQVIDPDRADLPENVAHVE